MAAGLVAVCWAFSTAVELTTGRQAGPVIAGNLIGGLGLLLLAASSNAGWLWAMTAIEALMFMLHAWFYGLSETPSTALVIANNLLVTAGLIVLVVAAFRSRRHLPEAPQPKPLGVESMEED